MTNTTQTNDVFDIDITEEAIDFSPADIPALEKHLKDIREELSEVSMLIRIHESGIGG